MAFFGEAIHRVSIALHSGNHSFAGQIQVSLLTLFI
jgi:hypothetical protein